MKVALRLATAAGILVMLAGCFSIGGSLGPSLSFDAKKPPAAAVPQDAIDAAKDGKGYVRSSTEWGIGEAPEKRATSTTEDGWAPTVVPPVQPKLEGAK